MRHPTFKTRSAPAFPKKPRLMGWPQCGQMSVSLLTCVLHAGQGLKFGLLRACGASGGAVLGGTAADAAGGLRRISSVESGCQSPRPSVHQNVAALIAPDAHMACN